MGSGERSLRSGRPPGGRNRWDPQWALWFWGFAEAQVDLGLLKDLSLIEQWILLDKHWP